MCVFYISPAGYWHKVYEPRAYRKKKRREYSSLSLSLSRAALFRVHVNLLLFSILVMDQKSKKKDVFIK
jgi:hypothetical protein